MLNDDYREILHDLLKNKVRFLVVGAYGMAVYGFPRATGDIDIWVDTEKGNCERVYKTLSDFGAPLKDLSPSTFCEKGIIFQIGVAPRRIDILTAIDGVTFEDAFTRKEEYEIDGLMIPFISKKDLIINKESTSRIKDKADAEELRKQRD
jgi:hypothetical protein